MLYLVQNVLFATLANGESIEKITGYKKTMDLTALHGIIVCIIASKSTDHCLTR